MVVHHGLVSVHHAYQMVMIALYGDGLKTKLSFDARIAFMPMTSIVPLHFQQDTFVRKDTGHTLEIGSVQMGGKKMTKKEAYQALEEQLNDFLRYGNKIEISADFIYELLPILRQPDIVRCNQCKHVETCCRRRTNDPNWFCADGQRRDED